MKVAPDHDWTDGFEVSNSIHPMRNLSRVLGPELRNTFASVASERLPETWIIYLLLASKQPVRSRGKQCLTTEGRLTCNSHFEHLSPERRFEFIADKIVPQRIGM